VLALSVDSEDDLDTFFEGVPMPDLVLGWAGDDALDEAGVDGVPAIFLLDGVRTVRFVTRSTRLEGSELWVLLAELGERRDSSILEEHGHEMIPVAPGEFLMGSPESERQRGLDEVQHPVRLTRAFELGATEVTIELFEAVMGQLFDDRLRFRRPMVGVSWFRAVEFCNRLSELEGLTSAYRIEDGEVIWDPAANGYRLPTEAEWEYAARADDDTLYSGSDDLEQVACHGRNSGFYCPLGSYQPNGWGFVDMSGNVWEWCWDGDADYGEGEEIDPVRPETNRFRIARGGSFRHKKAPTFRVANRETFDAGSRHVDLGFRIARTLVSESEPESEP
jgi:formylglycine-generating enzyme required for sulfatase activity